MFYEFAVDPVWVKSILDSREKMGNFMKLFGICSGIFPSRFPGKWSKIIEKSSQGFDSSDGIEKAREAFFIYIKEIALERNSTYDAGVDWVRNAYRDSQFDAIIVQEDTIGGNKKIVEGNNVINRNHSLWDIPYQVLVKRDSSSLSDAVAPLLKISFQFKFIDPYFDPSKDSYLEALRDYIEKSLIDRQRKFPTSIEIHCFPYKKEQLKSIDKSVFERNCLDLLPKIIPNKSYVTIYRWKEHIWKEAEQKKGEQFHNRYILTERGGLSLSAGLDRGHKDQQDDLTRLSQKNYETRWQQFSAGSTDFEPDGSFLVQGIKQFP